MNKPIMQESIAEKFLETTFTLKKVLANMSKLSVEDKFATMLQFQALSYLNKHQGCTVGELGNAINTSSAGVAQLTDRLFHANWIIREEDKSDRRVTHIKLTESGILELTRLKDHHLSKVKELLTLIPESDLVELVRIQTNLLKKLQKQA